MATTFDSIWRKPPLSSKLAHSAVVPTSQSFLWAMRVLCLVAMGITGYLAITALRSEDVAGCGSGATFDCRMALNSRWSKVVGVPVSVPAFALYALMLAALAFCGRHSSRARLQLAWETVTVGSIAAALAAIWFLSLQFFVLKHLCEYCIGAHVCGLILCSMVLWKRPLGGRTTAMLSSVSGLGAAALIATQLLTAPPPTFKMEHNPVAPAAGTAAHGTAAHGATQQPTKAPEVFEAPDASPAGTPEK